MSLRDLPDVFTVPEAAAILRIGRTMAYAQARLWRATGGREGLPVLTLGHRLFVSKAQLERMLGAEPPVNGGSPPDGGTDEAERDVAVSRDAGPGRVPSRSAVRAVDPEPSPRPSAPSTPLPEPTQLSLFIHQPQPSNRSR
jgi:hypothetical protein